MNDHRTPGKRGPLTVEQALEILLANARPVSGEEEVALHQALGRVLARGIVSDHTVPPHDNSAMDGYAVRSTEVEPGVTALRVAQRQQKWLCCI